MGKINSKVRIEGIRDIAAKMGKAMREVSEAVGLGMKDAGLHLQERSQDIVPVDQGNLKNSARTTAKGQGIGTVVVVGYTAAYAVYVHENEEAAHNPGTMAKFLEKPAREERGTMLEIVADRVEEEM